MTVSIITENLAPVSSTNYLKGLKQLARRRKGNERVTRHFII